MQQIRREPGERCKEDVEEVIAATPRTIPGVNCNFLQEFGHPQASFEVSVYMSSMGWKEIGKNRGWFECEIILSADWWY